MSGDWLGPESRMKLGPRWANSALIALGLAMLAFTRILTMDFDRYVLAFSTVSMAQAILYLASAGVIMKGRANQWTLGIVLTFAVAFRLICLLPAPHLSSDIYRYVWDGMVQHAGLNPYSYVPADEHLRLLRDGAIFPNINRSDYAHTIYPPGAQVIFYGVTGISASVIAMKVAMLGFECLLLWGLVKLMTAMGIARERSLLYAWNPLLIWEIGSSGHLDAAAMAFIVLALLFRFRKQPVATGLALGMAVMIKLYPIILLPALLRKRERRMRAAFLGVVVLGYALYARVGLLVFGFLGGYAHEEGLQSGERYFLLELARKMPGMADLPIYTFFIFSAICLCGLLWWTWNNSEKTDRSFISCGFAIAFAFMLLFSPHYPWYVAWLIPFAALIPNLPVFTYLLGFFYLFTTSLAVPGPRMFLLNEWLYGAVLAVTAACLLWRSPFLVKRTAGLRMAFHFSSDAAEPLREP